MTTRERDLASHDIDWLSRELQTIATTVMKDIAVLKEEHSSHCRYDKHHECIRQVRIRDKLVMPAGGWEPCPSIACQLEEMLAWATKIQRWAQRRMWAGSESKADDIAIETIPITAADFATVIIRADILKRSVVQIRAQLEAMPLAKEPLAKVFWVFLARHVIAIIIVIVIIIICIVIVAIAITSHNGMSSVNVGSEGVKK